MNPRYYQQQANDATWDFLATKQGNPLVVLPTGAGKSLVIAMLCKQAIEFGGRIVVLQHRKELIQQNAEKIQILLPGVPVGVFSAGLNSKQTSQPVLCAGIQSIWKKASEIGPRHLIIVDEAHLVSSNDETMYGSFLMEAQGLTPRSRVVGLTATPYRTGEGPICGPDKLFRRICYEAMTGDLISQGFLCPITNKVAEAQVNTEGIAIRGGEFVESDMQRAFGDNDAVSKACAEIVEKTQGRKSILIFASGVAHAEQVAATLMEMSEDPVGVVTGETFSMERANILKEFRDGRLRWLVSVDCLTTGFDAPGIDAIAILRATMSPGLFAQMVGRGLRKAPGKENCIAEGQRVLTDHGLVEIQHVNTAMKVWDGVEFVPHGGIILRGELPVISYAGLTATEDHNVWTEKGWMPLGIAKLTKAKICVSGHDELPIRESENCFRGDSQERERQGLRQNCLHRVRIRKPQGLRFRSFPESRLQEMRSQAKHQQAMFGCAQVVAGKMHFSERAMHESEFSKLEELRWPWNNVRFCITESDGVVSSGELLYHKRQGDRPHRQQSRLRSWEHSGCKADCKCKQSKRSRRNKTHAQVPHDVSTCAICGQHVIQAVERNDVCSGAGKIQQNNKQATRRVWDILNAGPRNRFTCEGLLVSNCTVLDFGENIKRHGSLDDPSYGRVSGAGGRQGKAAEANGRGKPCLACGIDVGARATECSECGFKFPVKHQASADSSGTLTGEYPPEKWVVESVACGKHFKRGDPEAPPTLRIDYTVKPEEGGLVPKTVSEWVCVEHEGFARVKAGLWWEVRSIAPMPSTVDEALSLLNRGACRMPSALETVRDGKYQRIKSVTFTDETPTEWADEEAEEIVTDSFGEEVPF